MNPVLQFGDRTLTASEVLQLLGKYQLVSPLLKELVIEEAIREIECTPEEEKQAYEKLAQQNQGKQEQEINQEKLNGAIKQLKLEKFKQATWGKDIDAYFYQRKPQLDRVIYSLITTVDMGIAQEIYFRIQEGEQSFAQAAREYAQGMEAQTDGLVGPVELQSIHPMLARVLSVNQPQTVAQPTQIGEWIVIVRLEKLLPAQLDSQMRQRLVNERFQSWLQKQVGPQNWQIQPSENINDR